MNGPRRESILESQVVLLLAHGASLALGLVITWLLARRLDDGAFAGFILLSGALSLAAQLIDAGLQPAVVAELAKDEVCGRQFRDRVFRQRFFLVAIAVVVAFLFRALLPKSLSWWLFLLTIATLPLRTFSAHFLASGRNRFAAWGGLLVRSSFCLAIVWLVQKEGHVLKWVLSFLLLREIAMSLYPCLALRWRSAEVSSRDSGGEDSQGSSNQGLAMLACATIFGAAYFHVDVFMLRAMSNATSVAQYGLAVRVLGPLLVSISLILSPFLPALSLGLGKRLGPGPLDVGLTVAATLGVILPISMVLNLSEPIVGFLSGEVTESAARSLSILAWTLPLVAIGAAFSTALILAQRYGTWALITGFGLVVNLGLNVIAIPQWGESGAAMATVATEFLVATLAVFSYRRGPNRPSIFTAKETAGAFLASFAPSALALAIYLLIFPDDVHMKLILASVLAFAAASLHMFFGMAKNLRQHFEERQRLYGEQV